MIAQTHSATIVGIDALPIVVEVDLQAGVSEFVLVGLADKAVQESRERVRTALQNSELAFPFSRIICNLAPGDIRKEGPFLDLPIAMAILAASNQVPMGELCDTVFIGELGLDGVLRRIDGAVNVAMMCHARGIKRLVLPAANAAEACVTPSVEVYGVRTLLEAVELLNGSLFVQPYEHQAGPQTEEPDYDVDFRDVKGQTHAIRALEIAAAGGHNMLMVGPPGSGKTMLARRLPTILPPLSLEEAIEVTRIHSACGVKQREGLVWTRPFRAPHHTTSYAAVVGGGKHPKPGEVSMAHLGVLFMDEMPEYNREVLEALRQPLEDGIVTVSRVSASLTFPAESILIGAMNPCPCGFKGYAEAKCVGAAACDRYAGRISGPLLDRIDLHLAVPRLTPEELTRASHNECSAAIRDRVRAARERQIVRLGAGRVNGKMSPRDIRETVPLDASATEFMRQVSARLNLSARVYDRLLKVARTIADLAGREALVTADLAEAVQYRTL